MSGRGSVRRRRSSVSSPRSPAEATAMDTQISAGADATAPGQTFYQKLMIRVIFGLILGAFFLLLMLLPHTATAVILIFGQILAWRELVSLRFNINKEKKMGGPWFRTFNWYLLFVAMFYCYGRDALNYAAHHLPSLVASARPLLSLIVDNFRLTSFLLYLSAFLCFIVTLQRDSLRYQLTQLTWTLLTLLLILFQSHFAIYHIYDGLIWLYAPHGLIIINDIMAYVFGVKWGRKVFGDRPLTVLSPNKTWEGFIGGLFSTVILGFALAPLFAYYHWLTCPAGTWDASTRTCPNLHPIFKYTDYALPTDMSALLSVFGMNVKSVSLLPFQWHVVNLALFASIIAPFGGFLASGIKRAYNKKDFDSTIPGHGGLMDRVDCQFLMAFFTHVYYVTFIAPLASVDSIIAQIALLAMNEQREIFNKLELMLAKP